MSYSFGNMTSFKTLALGLLMIVMGPRLSWACEHLLRNSPYQVPASAFLLPAGAGAIQAPLFPIAEGHDDFWTIAFDLRFDKKIESQLISGKIRQGSYVASDVKPTRRDGEKAFFKYVARMHGVADQTINLRRKHARCETIYVNGWIEIKLWMKHGLRISDVKALLESGDTERVFDDGLRDRRYRIQAHDRAGRLIAIVIAEKEDCPNVLVTAYPEVSDEMLSAPALN